MPPSEKSIPSDAGTRGRLLEAGIELLGTEGARALTLRGVETRAAAPHGSVRYHFGGLDGLTAAILQELVRLDAAAMDAPPSSATDPAEAIAETLAHWLTEDRTRLLARYELMLAAARDASLQAPLRRSTARFHADVAAVLTDPSRARVVIAALDGLLLDSVARGPATRPDIIWAIRQLLAPPGMHGTGLDRRSAS